MQGTWAEGKLGEMDEEQNGPNRTRFSGLMFRV